MEGASQPTLGRQFAEAFADRDFERIRGLLAPEVDFRGLTPNRNWEASDAEGVVSGILAQWIEEADHIDEVINVEEETMADRERVSYRYRGHNDDGDFVVEQQAYYAEENGRISWMRVLCSGFRPL